MGARSTSRQAAEPRATGTRRLHGPRRVVRPPHTRVRWDRVGRLALLVMFGVVALLYAQHALSYLSVRHQFQRQGQVVRTLERQNAGLLAEQKALQDPANIVLLARQLGMVRPGERPYVITGLSGH